MTSFIEIKKSQNVINFNILDRYRATRFYSREGNSPDLKLKSLIVFYNSRSLFRIIGMSTLKQSSFQESVKAHLLYILKTLHKFLGNLGNN